MEASGLPGRAVGLVSLRQKEGNGDGGWFVITSDFGQLGAADRKSVVCLQRSRKGITVLAFPIDGGLE